MNKNLNQRILAAWRGACISCGVVIPLERLSLRSYCAECEAND